MQNKHQHIPMCSCESSQLRAYGYDAATQTLAVQFKNGGTYHYQEVPPDIHNEMGKAQSVGVFLVQHVKGKFGHIKADSLQEGERGQQMEGSA